jgi:signal transduction histidine kinase
MAITPPRRLRVVFIVALLLVTLVVVVALAVQAITTSRYHQTTAEKVLRDYARLAAGQYAGRASQDIYYNLVNPAIQKLARATGKGLPRGGADTLPGGAVFQLEGDSLSLLIGPDSLLRWRQWIADTVRAHRKSLAAMAPFGGIVRAEPGRAYFLAYLAQAPIRGFLIPLRVFEPTLAQAATRGPLLPPSLTDGAGLDSLVSIRVTSPDGTVLYQSADFPSTFVGRDSTGNYVGHLPVQAALRPDIAGILIIGGLPRSRLPVLLGLMLLTVALIVAALFLLRREQELGRLRSEFVSGVSHELRTPLAQIRMFAETLRLGRVRNENERQRSLTIVDQEARRLTHLVENLLYFSRSEQHSQRITPGPIMLGPLVREIAEGFSSLAAVRDMRIEMTARQELSAYADPDSVRQILLNLFDNAVKYGRTGQTILVTLGERGGRASLEVEDEGPGIPEKDRERVWQRFSRLDRDREAGVTGTGIGLAIVRELATLHGGNATIESNARGGAKFVVTLGTVTSRVPRS